MLTFGFCVVSLGGQKQTLRTDFPWLGSFAPTVKVISDKSSWSQSITSFEVVVKVVVGGRTLCWCRWEFVQSSSSHCLIFPVNCVALQCFEVFPHRLFASLCVFRGWCIFGDTSQAKLHMVITQASSQIFTTHGVIRIYVIADFVCVQGCIV